MVSLETWAHGLYYAAFFPLAGAFLDATHAAAGYAWIGLFVAATSLPLLVWARARHI